MFTFKNDKLVKILEKVVFLPHLGGGYYIASFSGVKAVVKKKLLLKLRLNKMEKFGSV